MEARLFILFCWEKTDKDGNVAWNGGKDCNKILPLSILII